MKLVPAVLAVACATSACTSTLSGQLVDASGGELRLPPDTRVNIAPLNASGSTLVLEVTSSGRFTSDADLPSGDYLVEALAPGYKTASRTVAISKGTSDPVVIKLAPARVAPGAASVNLDAPVGLGAGSAALMPPSF